MLFVAQVGFVGSAAAGAEAGGRWIVLHDVVVPVDEPDITVGANFSLNGARPFVVAGYAIPGILRAEACALRPQNERGDQMTGGLADKGRAVPVFAGIVAGGVKSVPGGSREAAVPIDLPHIFGNRVEAVAVGDAG